jgi:signal transduction histidine kinase
MVNPIRELQEGAARIGAGELAHRIDIKTGDELEALGQAFNRTAGQLEESYAGLERKVEERTRELAEANAELSEALKQQTATSEVLKVISRSTFDLQPVLETLIENATQLCGATRGHIFRYDGAVLRFAVSYGATPDFVQWLEWNPILLDRGSVAGRAASEQRTVHVYDVLAEPGYEQLDLQRLQDYRTVLAVPMLREGLLLGVITILKSKVEPFNQRSIDLVTTFADQAVIAIENVRLLQELRARTGELARSVEELQALGEVSRAVSSSLDLETVLATIVARAVELSASSLGIVYEYDDTLQEFRNLRGAIGLDPELAEVLRVTPIRLGEGIAGRTAALRAPFQFADVSDEQTYDVDRIRGWFQQMGYRSALGVPLLFEQRVIGVLVLARKELGSFSPEIVNLLQTFANQSVLAIQNARLFREIADKSRQLEAASRHKSEFLASMSHELRTPLNAILGFNEMILGQVYGEVPAALQEPLADIQSSGRHLLRLINNVLDLSKIEAGRMELALADYSVQDMVEGVRVSLHSLAEGKGLEFVTRVPADLPLAHGDGGRMAQCLMNLAGNAIKFTRRGRVEINAELRGDLLIYRVADTGIGIAKDKIDALFDEFRQADATITSEFGGTGLGLSITRKFVALHKGKVWVESELGRGSTFFVAIPLRLDEGTTA